MIRHQLPAANSSSKEITMSKFILVVALCGGVALLGGCSSSTPVQPPLSAFQPEIINNQDSFQFQATGLNGISATVSYTWDNSAAQATINHSSAVTGGVSLLQVLDDNGLEVYSDSLQASANVPTAVGQAGTWTVNVTLTSIQGTLNFRAESL
jgi:hypothetical protein